MKKVIALVVTMMLGGSLSLVADVSVSTGTIKIGDKVTIGDESSKNSKGNNGKSEYAPGQQGKSKGKSKNSKDDATIKIKL